MMMHKYLQDTQLYRKDNPYQRVGQALFNCFYMIRPVEAITMRGTKLDPFYDDRNIFAFLVEVARIFDEEAKDDAREQRI